MLLNALDLGSLLPDASGMGPFAPLLCSCPDLGVGVEKDPPPCPHPLPPVSGALCCRQDNLANELVKRPLVTCPGLLSAHLGNSIERLSASSASPPSVAAGGANPLTLDPYIKIITPRNRWPTPDARAHLGRGSRCRPGRAAARPGVRRSGPPYRQPGGRRGAFRGAPGAQRPSRWRPDGRAPPGGGERAARVREGVGAGAEPRTRAGRAPRLEHIPTSGRAPGPRGSRSGGAPAGRT